MIVLAGDTRRYQFAINLQSITSAVVLDSQIVCNQYKCTGEIKFMVNTTASGVQLDRPQRRAIVDTGRCTISAGWLVSINPPSTLGRACSDRLSVARRRRPARRPSLEPKLPLPLLLLLVVMRTAVWMSWRRLSSSVPGRLTDRRSSCLPPPPPPQLQIDSDSAAPPLDFRPPEDTAVDFDKAPS